MNDLRGNLIALRLNKHGRFLHSEEHADFLVHTYTDIALDRPWTYYEYLEPRSAVYDAGKSWLGIALFQVEEQCPAQGKIDLGRDPALWV